MTGASGGQADGRWAHPDALKAGEIPGIRAAGALFAVLLLGGSIAVTFVSESVWLRSLMIAGVGCIAAFATLAVLRLFRNLAFRKSARLHAAYHQNMDQERSRQLAEFKEANPE